MLVLRGVIHPVASASTLTGSIIYIYYRNLQFLDHVIIIKTKDLPVSDI
jgi:hypothetical protein